MRPAELGRTGTGTDADCELTRIEIESGLAGKRAPPRRPPPGGVWCLCAALVRGAREVAGMALCLGLHAHARAEEL
jgi:hypothetical protein